MTVLHSSSVAHSVRTLLTLDQYYWWFSAHYGCKYINMYSIVVHDISVCLQAATDLVELIRKMETNRMQFERNFVPKHGNLFAFDFSSTPTPQPLWWHHYLTPHLSNTPWALCSQDRLFAFATHTQRSATRCCRFMTFKNPSFQSHWPLI